MRVTRRKLAAFHARSRLLHATLAVYALVLRSRARLRSAAPLARARTRARALGSTRFWFLMKRAACRFLKALRLLASNRGD